MFVRVARSRPERSIVTTRMRPLRTPFGSRMRTRPWLASPDPRATTWPPRLSVMRAARTRAATASLSVHFTRTFPRRTLAGPQEIVAPRKAGAGISLRPRRAGAPVAPA